MKKRKCTASCKCRCVCTEIENEEMMIKILEDLLDEHKMKLVEFKEIKKNG
jgi:hypothetical protein